MKQPITADIPRELEDVDEILTRYGRAVMDRYRKHHCASAEGRYAIPPNDDDREPREVLMHEVDVQLVQRALASVEERFRVILQILYVPKRLPAAAQLRIAKIPPAVSCERHLAGLRFFASRYRTEQLLAHRARGGLRRVMRRTAMETMLATAIAPANESD
jgi:hypothetical protein